MEGPKMEGKVKNQRSRSTAYPYVDLEHAIELLDKLTAAVGKGSYNRQAASEGIGHPKVTGPSASKIAALVHFGLLSRSGGVYSQSPLAARIQVPTSEEDKVQAIREAIKQPKLYKSLMERYANQSLPTLFTNILIREYGIGERVAKDVAKNFRKSLEFTGFLVNGILKADYQKDVTNGQSDELIDTESPKPQNPARVKASDDGYPVDLLDGIVVIFPKKFMRDAIRGEFIEGVNKLEEKARSLAKQQEESSETDSDQ